MARAEGSRRNSKCRLEGHRNDAEASRRSQTFRRSDSPSEIKACSPAVGVKSSTFLQKQQLTTMALHEIGTILAFIVPVRGVDFECRPLDSQGLKCFPFTCEG